MKTMKRYANSGEILCFEIRGKKNMAVTIFRCFIYSLYYFLEVLFFHVIRPHAVLIWWKVKIFKEVITTKKGCFQILIDFMILESAGSLNQNSSEFFGLLFSMAVFNHHRRGSEHTKYKWGRDNFTGYSSHLSYLIIKET